MLYMLLSINPSLLGYLNEFNTLSHAHSVPPTDRNLALFRSGFTIDQHVYPFLDC
jgi:hypothetical protein